MKKIVLALLVATGLAHATYDFCETCEDGQDGVNGLSAYQVAQVNGFDGTESEWLSSLVGAAGADGESITGAAGADGQFIVGADGSDGANGTSVNLEGYTEQLKATETEVRKATELANQAVAGSAAMATIDFGTTRKGKTEVGIGVGMADSYVGTDYAGAVGIKHGMTDNTAAIAKGWKSKNATGAGLAVTYAF